MSSLILGIDISTTSAKAILIDFQGNVISTASTSLSLLTPRPLWSEQNPFEWWFGVKKSIKQVISNVGVHGEDIVSVGLTGQMHGLVLVNQKGAVLRPAILWNDQRTALQCDEIRNLLGKNNLIQITGNDALTGFTAPKILWVKENEPEIFSEIYRILLPKDYIRYCLTNRYAMDKADGSGTILFDLKNRNWSDYVLSHLQIPSEWLPDTYEGMEITGEITNKAAELTGLRPGTPVVAGGGDQAAQAVGVGVVDPGIIALTLGTSGVVFASTSNPLIEPEGRLHSFCHALPNRWHLMGVMLSAAGSLQWYRDTLAEGIPFDQIIKEAEDVAPGSEGLLFLPYLTGERTPYPDPYARAAWVGLTLRHARRHMTRAVLEGVAFGIRDIFTLIQEVGLGNIDQVRISGGGARSLLWRQILSSVLNAELVTVNTTEGAAYGAALLAGVGVGHWSNAQEACKMTVKITGRTSPQQDQVSIYQESYERYRALYPALKLSFDSMR